jgi:subtilisin family serine protease
MARSAQKTPKQPAPPRPRGAVGAKGAGKVKARSTADSDRAKTIVYVHGVGNKPEEAVLRCQWDNALLSFGLGERSRMAYWVQADRHGPPEVATCADGDVISARALHSTGRLGARGLERQPTTAEVVEAITSNPQRQAALERLADEMGAPASGGVKGAKRAQGVGAKGFENVNFFDPIAQLVTALFLKDVHDFFFEPARRERMKAILRNRLFAGNGPFVVVAHSQGSMIAYSVLQELKATDVKVVEFVTIGSPLGLAEVRDQLRKINGLGPGKLPAPDCVQNWTNVFDRRDIVAQRERLSKHYTGHVVPVDHELENPEGRRDAHSATGYLQLATVRTAAREAVDLPRFQRTAQFKLAADATTDFERAPRGERRPLLIELTDPVWALNQRPLLDDTQRKKPLPDSRTAMATRVVEMITRVSGLRRDHPALRLQRLERYVSVDLTEQEAQRLTSDEEFEALGLALPPLYRVWRNARKYALLDKSIHQVQASPAHSAYQATGRGIQWAILDSGCSPHPHFEGRKNIVARWDCTTISDTPEWDRVLMKAPGDARALETVKRRRGPTADRFGHGTHVAGIVAGGYTFGRGHRGPSHLAAIAPDTRLHIYKVLDDEGSGDDAAIIKALDHIAAINDKAGALEIAGVNLSLGGEFEQGVFGCGHTPLCDELRRLWRQGVVVVLAAGNEGFRRLLSTDGDFGANMPCSIGDPANLEEAIAVGAVHKEKPHTYGVSHFSSRGPTADGRKKPDCVAPGEQILSCRHDPRMPPRKKTPRTSDLYYKLDGTSMAAPHVSGLIACFLSLRREFIGQPDRVKRILLENCTDLERDRAMQGAGMPNLIKMLVQT